jgi:arylsulfatase A-like enzyme
VKWPGRIEPGGRITTNVQTSDIFPTLCEVVGEDPCHYEGLEGLSLFGLLTRGEHLDREAIFAFRSYDGQYASVLTADHWKLIAYRDGHHDLYKVDEDISETEELSGSNPEKVMELTAILDKWLDRTGIIIE